MTKLPITSPVVFNVQQDIQKLIAAAQHDKAVYTELAATGEFNKPAYNARMKEVHDTNAELLKKFLATYGWPFPDKYGIDAHEAAWLIAIHAIAYPALIKEVASTLEKAYKSGNISGKYYANFYDRIALYEGRKQRYGTHLFPSPNGWRMLDLEDELRVNELRAQMDMPTIQEWIAECNEDGSGVSDFDEEIYQKEFLKWCYETGWRK